MEFFSSGWSIIAVISLENACRLVTLARGITQLDFLSKFQEDSALRFRETTISYNSIFIYIPYSWLYPQISIIICLKPKLR